LPDVFDHVEEYLGVNDEHLYVRFEPADAAGTAKAAETAQTQLDALHSLRLPMHNHLLGLQKLLLLKVLLLKQR